MLYSPQYKDFLLNLENRDRKNIAASQKGLYEEEHKYELTNEEVEKIFVREIYKDVIGTNAFQRLKKIHFLGSIDYVIDPNGPKPNKRHTRYQHSLGVARLALQFAREKQLDEKQEMLCVVSALLHDIGHAPLSHSLESVFKEEYGIGHHVVGEKIIKGDVSLGEDLHSTLLKWNINPFEVLEIINGTGPVPHREIFSYSINIDTIEAILRSSTYVYANLIFWPPSKVLSALLRRDADSTKVLDSFWLLKDEIYGKLINHRMGILADYVCQEYMRNRISSFIEEYFYATDQDLNDRHPDLFWKLKVLADTEPGELLPNTTEITFIDRQFVINRDVLLENIRDVDARYAQIRREGIYRITNN